MSVIFTKGSSYGADYSSTDYPTLSDDWTAKVQLFTDFPGEVSYEYALTRIANIMRFSLSVSDIQNIVAGVYYLVTSFTNAVLGVTIESVEYLTVTGIPVISAEPSCLITMTILKSDGSAAGSQTYKLLTTTTGVTTVLGWKGVDVTVTNQIVDAVSGKIIDNEVLKGTTNAVGYLQFNVIRGTTQLVSCQFLGKTVTINTTGLESVDLSSYF